MDLVVNFVLVLFTRSSLGAALQAAFKITSPTGKFHNPHTSISPPKNRVEINNSISFFRRPDQRVPVLSAYGGPGGSAAEDG